MDQAISVFSKVKGKNCVENAGACNNLGAAYQMLGNMNEAVRYYGKALDIFKTIHHETHIECAILYMNIARIHRDKQNFKEAI